MLCTFAILSEKRVFQWEPTAISHRVFFNEIMKFFVDSARNLYVKKRVFSTSLKKKVI